MKQNTLNRDDWEDILENTFCWIVVFAMFVYGFSKPWQFGTPDLETPLGEMKPMRVMWSFYGYSKSFAILLGIVEVSGGLLLLIPKTRLLGAILLTGMLLNIIAQDIFYEVHLGALKAAILYQTILFGLLWRKRKKLIEALRILTIQTKKEGNWRKMALKLGIAFVLFILIRYLEWIVTIRY